MRRDEAWARQRFTEARVARLATASVDGSPHLVPILFAVEDSTVISAVDHKPKTTTALRRLDNIAVNPFVSVLVDYYDDADWNRLWWARADGWARIHDSYDLSALAARYRQYQATPPSGPVIVVQVDHWSAWSAN